MKLDLGDHVFPLSSLVYVIFKILHLIRNK